MTERYWCRQTSENIVLTLLQPTQKIQRPLPLHLNRNRRPIALRHRLRPRRHLSCTLHHQRCSMHLRHQRRLIVYLLRLTHALRSELRRTRSQVLPKMQPLRHSTLRRECNLLADPACVYERQQQLLAGLWVVSEYHYGVGTYRMGCD
jgi:hypothetical protein